MSAESTFRDPATGNQLTIKLYPLGLTSKYAFGAFKPANFPNAYVIFSVDLQFQNATSSLLMLNPPAAGYNCHISSSNDSEANAELIVARPEES